MTVSRLLFLAKYRVPHALFSMQWDHNIQGIDRTIVCSPVPRDDLWRAFDAYRIDTSRFEYINDAEIFSQYPQVQNWVFDGDYRGWWLRQQAIKLSYLDKIQDDVMLMWDPDTFMVEPYRCYDPDTDTVNMMTLLNTTQGSYEGVFEAITGIPRTTPHCFVTELVPVRGRDFSALKSLLGQRWPNQHWLDAIIDAVPGMPTIPPWGNGNIIKWFSEYEFVGNWAVHCGNVAYHDQRRFEYDNLNKLTQLDPTQFNAVCDAVPDLSLSMQFDWENYTVPDFERYRDMVLSALTR
jgi:hypothetical protein